MALWLLIRSLGKSLTTHQKLDLAKHWERLQARVDAFNQTTMNFLGRNIQQTISENVSLLSEEFNMDDELQIDDPLLMKNLDRNALQVIFVEGAPTGCLTPAEVALAKASQAAAAAQSALEAVEHIKIPLPSTLGVAELKA